MQYGIVLVGAYISSDALMELTMSAEYMGRVTDTLVKMNDHVYNATGINAMANSMGWGNYENVRMFSDTTTKTVMYTGLQNPKRYGTNDNNPERETMLKNAEQVKAEGDIWHAIR